METATEEGGAVRKVISNRSDGGVSYDPLGLITILFYFIRLHGQVRQVPMSCLSQSQYGRSAIPACPGRRLDVNMTTLTGHQTGFFTLTASFYLKTSVRIALPSRPAFTICSSKCWTYLQCVPFERWTEILCACRSSSQDEA